MHLRLNYHTSGVTTVCGDYPAEQNMYISLTFVCLRSHLTQYSKIQCKDPIAFDQCSHANFQVRPTKTCHAARLYRCMGSYLTLVLMAIGQILLK